MKSVYYLITILLLTILSNFYSQGNRVNYERDTKWNFGINAGATWTEKELDFINKPGLSGGLTLGRAIYEKEGRLLSFDLRGRLLLGQTKSWSPKPSYDTLVFPGGIGYKNYKLGYTEGAIELVVNAHRLREQTGILFYGFGGVGWVSHSVNHNYKGGSSFYDYTAVDSTAGNVAIVEALNTTFNDNNWETDNEFFTGRKTLIMPSLGLGLGYQITPKLSVGVEHKVTFGLNDQLDGHLDGKNDRLHYTNFNLRWNLFRGERGNGSTYIPEERPINKPNVPVGNNNPSSNGNTGDYSTPPSTDIPEGNKPLVNITSPSSNGTTVNSSSYVVNAKVYYVESKADIMFKHNGNIVNNNNIYSLNSKVFSSTVNLVPGTNTFEIGATNDDGSDSDSKTISYTKICNKPTVNFIKPTNNGSVLSNPSTVIEAKILNVSNANNIKFSQNGVVNNQFTFNGSSKLLVANVTCSSGNNTFQIEATNDCGVKVDSRTIVYNKTIISGNPPIVTITNPSNSPFTVNVNSASVSAIVQNVNNASNIQYKLNGVISNNFNYNISTKVFNATMNLQNGSNIIEIRGTNNYGVDSKSIIIIRKEEQQLPKPIVNIDYPTINPLVVSTNSSVVNGRIYNVLSRNQIQVLINGVVNNNFNYNQNTKKISLTTGLNTGSNVITIKGSNNSGSDLKSTTIIYKKQVVMSPPTVNFIYPSSSPTSVASANVVIKARVLNVNNASQIQVVKNGVSIQSFNYNLGTKELLLNTALISGSNSFVITATNQAGADTKTSIVIYKKQISQLPPLVTVLSPQANPYSTTASNSNVSARVDNVSNQSQILLSFNGVPTSNFSYNSGTKTVIFNAGLVVGSNSIVITASNTSGSDSKSTTIIRSSPCLAPVLSYQIPARSPYNHVGRNGNMAFTFSSSNLTSISQVLVKNNGFVIPASLEVSNGNIWGTIPLVNGANTIEVSAKNTCGKDKKVLQVTYKTPAYQTPIITIQSPSSFPFTTNNSSVTVLGKVVNVLGQNNIQVTMDGSNIPFTYNSSNKSITIPASLSLGSHQVKVRATNNYGNDLEVFDLVRTGQPPLVQFTNIGSSNSPRNPFVSPQTSFTVQGRIINFQNVTFNAYVNGNRISNYTYDARNGSFSIPVSFSIQGQGTQRKREVEVKVSNSVGRGSKKGYLSYIVQSTVTKPNVVSGSINTSLPNKVYEDNLKKGDAYYKQGKYNEAKNYYKKAATLKPKESYPKQRISEVNSKLKAEKESTKVVSPKVKNPVIITPKVNGKKVVKPTNGKKEINNSTLPISKP